LTTCLIAVLWGKALAKVDVSFSLSLLKWPVVVIVTLLFVGDLVSSILHGSYFPRGIIVVLAGVLMIIAQLCIGLLFLVKGSQVLRVLRRAVDIVDRKSLQRMTTRLIVSGIGMLIFVIAVVGASAGLIFAGPRPYIAIFFVVYCSLVVTSLCQITAIALPTKSTGKITPLSDSSQFSETKTAIVPS